ncbi:MAG: PstS family phosphate ABC transporter substrate-binding protein, partial [Candidatus Binatia bacterium]
IPVALDAIVLLVHHRNPLQGLTLAQVKKLFAMLPGKDGVIENWQQVGLNSKLGSVDINRYGRDETSGTFAAFRDMGLLGTKQRSDVHAQPGSMSVVIEVGSDEAGIGYASTGYANRSKKVRVVPLARREGEPFVTPTNESVESGDYPLRRELYLYVMPEQNGSVSPAIKEFITFVLSRDGQQLAKDEGLFPLPARVTEQALRKLEGNGQLTPTSASATR